MKLRHILLLVSVAAIAYLVGENRGYEMGFDQGTDIGRIRQLIDEGYGPDEIWEEIKN